MCLPILKSNVAKGHSLNKLSCLLMSVLGMIIANCCIVMQEP